MPAAEAFLFPDNLAALATCRELGKAGIRTTVLGSKPGPAAYSRYSRFVRTPDLYAAPGDLVNAIIEQARTRAAKPVLFPTEDAALLVAEHFHAALAGWLQLPHPAPGIITEDSESNFALRLGAGWDFELGRGFSLAPEVNFDFVDGDDNALVIGLTTAYSF